MPEKTLEHWMSMHLARRFPTVRLWWPAAREDISVEGVPSSPGKSVLLEVKTTEWDGALSQHRLTLDVEQLRAYQHSAIPVYYILPIPPWSGLLNPDNPWLGSRSRTELLLPGTGWFGDWTFVVSAEDLWLHLSSPNRQAQKTASLFTHNAGSRRLNALVPSLTRSWSWDSFWTHLASCGSPAMPSLLATPSGRSLGQRVPRQRLAENLSPQEAAGLPRVQTGDALQAPTFYQPLGDNDFYSLISEASLTESLKGLNGYHQSTSVVHLTPSDLTLGSGVLRR